MLDETRRQLTANGFTEERPQFMSHMLALFTRPVDGSPFKIRASWSKDGTVESVNFALELSTQQRIGTVHRVFSAIALTKALPTVLTHLERLAVSHDLLKCPECGLRYVHLKEPGPGKKQFRPFLSCSGMRVVRKSFEGQQYKDVNCRGTSTKIPPLVIYR